MEYSRWLLPWRMRHEPMFVELERLVECLQTIEDRRDARGRRYPLWLLLIVALLAKLAGANDVQSLTEWACHRSRELCRMFGFWRSRMPVATICGV